VKSAVLLMALESRALMRTALLKLVASMGCYLRGTAFARSKTLNQLHGAIALALYRSNEVKVDGFTIRFDPRDRFIAKKLFLYEEYEKYELQRLCSCAKPGDVVLDIGANIGVYTLYLSRAVGPKGHVVAVEPDPENLSILRDNIKLNGCDNVTILPCAFGASSGWVNLFQDDKNRGRLSLTDLARSGRSVRVPIVRGSEALEKLALQPTVVKMDVEGVEPVVFDGLGYRPRVLLFEFAPQQLEAAGNDPKLFLDSLISEGYKLDLINPLDGSNMGTTSNSILAAIANSKRSFNILAVREHN
jgi:FkbM family methyltransferase